ncbi:putative GAL4-like Zn(II)2Cys6 (or C6 zinc) binuclear cluster DNA-binding domain [Lyophyllum shimeji]|uniref:GAL4-like Zn(II)2Cys6 (Or C6 zinc) binuclear cluster DNA-binding domain n=1 Tax=Lyophyllum shimeji TaxID=47721 RepID=A0A9P3PRA7_LYOSH|nr:putative GAL4-like Zn(II)2Cys6 (or C6 zinc) binuclear cluster DNA-binding domain [Lyophyllum shimeji]
MSTVASYSEPAAASQQAASASTSTITSGQVPAAQDDVSKKKKVTKRRKVNHACLYCRRSHMTCDEGRPCQRCIKREIGHLCHDERRPKATDKQPTTPGVDMTRTFAPVTVYQAPQPAPQPTNSAWPMSVPQGQFLYQPETLGNEFSVLSDFLETLDEGSFFTSPPNNLSSSLLSYSNPPGQPSGLTQPNFSADASASTSDSSNGENAETTTAPTTETSAEDLTPVLPAATKTEKFLLTAADQESGSRNERLNRVIRSKYEAGLLKPYNYVKGYARLSRWMDRNVSQESKQQILQPLSVLRPKFRAVAQSLRDIDLVFIEEAFERLLLDYDRVFSAMGVPACLWRRTGEIYKGNREFSELIGVEGYMLRDGRLCIYELMAEESAVNYWEKYGHVAFDSSQKAVLTSCVLRYKPHLNAVTATDKEDQEGKEVSAEEGFINCCFSFTIRRDKWGIPTMIVGNFIKC